MTEDEFAAEVMKRFADPKDIVMLRNSGVVEAEKGNAKIAAIYFEKVLSAAITPENVEIESCDGPRHPVRQAENVGRSPSSVRYSDV